MKYIVFKHNDVLVPIILPEHATHSQVTLYHSIPVSAGFFSLDKFGKVKVFSHSESMNLKPLDGDAELIENTLNNSGIYAFLQL